MICVSITDNRTHGAMLMVSLLSCLPRWHGRECNGNKHKHLCYDKCCYYAVRYFVHIKILPGVRAGYKGSLVTWTWPLFSSPRICEDTCNHGGGHWQPGGGLCGLRLKVIHYDSCGGALAWYNGVYHLLTNHCYNYYRYQWVIGAGRGNGAIADICEHRIHRCQ